MRHLLDTSICVPLLDGLNGAIRLRYDEVALEGGLFFMPFIVAFELWYGVYRSTYLFANRQRLLDFLDRQIEVLDLNAADAQAAGTIRASLEARKLGIGPMETLIAGQALARGLTLVTANVREFLRVEGLKWEDWS